MALRLLTTTSDVAQLCEDYANSPYVTIDTEFLRERTYWPVLCLVQLARPQRDGESDEDWERDGAVMIDALAKGIDLEPLYKLMRDQSVLKVFHAARQDIEIFVKLSGSVPIPIFDTQVAAMVCGFGDQAGYERLVKGILGQGLDKSSRFTDWSKRPLTDKQLTYAIADVTHLRDIYETLAARLKADGRASWVDEEMAVLRSEETYIVRPPDAWKRLKLRSPSPKMLAAAKGLAEWREAEAQGRDVPRTRVLKDDALLEIAAAQPTNPEGVTSGRMSRRESLSKDHIRAILDVIENAEPGPAEKRRPEPRKPTARQAAINELLRTLLRARAAEAEVAERLIASAADLERLAMEDEPDVRALTGWRMEIFGTNALQLKDGKVGLTAGKEGIEVISLE